MSDPVSEQHTLGIALNYTDAERENIKQCLDFMKIAYDPKRSSSDAVKHLCTKDSEFVGQSTFPKCKTVLDYAEIHGEIMKSISDLKILQYDAIICKTNMVCLRYTAQGSHSGEALHGVKGNGKHAIWHAAVIFELKLGKIHKMWKEWDKALMFRQLEFPVEEYTDVASDLEVTKKHLFPPPQPQTDHPARRSSTGKQEVRLVDVLLPH